MTQHSPRVGGAGEGEEEEAQRGHLPEISPASWLLAVLQDVALVHPAMTPATSPGVAHAVPVAKAWLWPWRQSRGCGSTGANLHHTLAWALGPRGPWGCHWPATCRRRAPPPQFPPVLSGSLRSAVPIQGSPAVSLNHHGVSDPDMTSDFQTLGAQTGGSCPPSPKCLWLCRASRAPGTRGHGTSSSTPLASTPGATTSTELSTTKVSRAERGKGGSRGQTVPWEGGSSASPTRVCQSLPEGLVKSADSRAADSQAAPPSLAQLIWREPGNCYFLEAPGDNAGRPRATLRVTTHGLRSGLKGKA